MEMNKQERKEWITTVVVGIKMDFGQYGIEDQEEREEYAGNYACKYANNQDEVNDILDELFGQD